MEILAEREQQPSRGTDSRERRKEQNKLAQRRFREKLRQRQQKLYLNNTAEQDTNQLLDFDPYATSSPNTLGENGLSLPSQEYSLENARECCQDGNSFNMWLDGWSPDRLDSESNDWSISCLDSDFNIGGETGASGQPNQSLQGFSALNLTKKPACRAMIDDEEYPRPFEKMNLPILRQPTAPILDNQRNELCCQANELLQRVLSIYEIGISLRIFPAAPVVSFHLKRALERFRLLEKRNCVAEPENDVGSDFTLPSPQDKQV